MLVRKLLKSRDQFVENWYPNNIKSFNSWLGIDTAIDAFISPQFSFIIICLS